MMQQQMVQEDNNLSQQCLPQPQQMMLCPVRVVYEMDVLMPPGNLPSGDQIQPNQTIYINPQNPPPWIQNVQQRIQPPIQYIQQMPGNIIPTIQQPIDQNQLYAHNYQNCQSLYQMVIQNPIAEQHRQIAVPIQTSRNERNVNQINYAHVPIQSQANIAQNNRQMTPNIVNAVPNQEQQMQQEMPRQMMYIRPQVNTQRPLQFHPAQNLVNVRPNLPYYVGPTFDPNAGLMQNPCYVVRPTINQATAEPVQTTNLNNGTVPATINPSYANRNQYVIPTATTQANTQVEAQNPNSELYRLIKYGPKSNALKRRSPEIKYNSRTAPQHNAVDPVIIKRMLRAPQELKTKPIDDNVRPNISKTADTNSNMLDIKINATASNTKTAANDPNLRYELSKNITLSAPTCIPPIAPMPDKDKLLRNTVYTQAKGRILKDKDTPVIPIETLNKLALEMKPSAPINIETNETKTEIQKANIVVLDMKAKNTTNDQETIANTPAESAEEEIPDKGMTEQENCFILTHVLDGFVIQESNIAFPIRKPLKERSRNKTAWDSNLNEQMNSMNGKEMKKDVTSKDNTRIEVPTRNMHKLNISKEYSEMRDTKLIEHKEENDKDNPFYNLPKAVVKSWRVDQLASHLSKYEWIETMSTLQEHEIDGESLFMVNKTQLEKIGICENHADSICQYIAK